MNSLVLLVVEVFFVFLSSLCLMFFFCMFGVIVIWLIRSRLFFLMKWIVFINCLLMCVVRFDFEWSFVFSFVRVCVSGGMLILL